jgi:hypothetical protein
MRQTIAAEGSASPRAVTPPAPSVIDNVRLIRGIDLGKTLAETRYKRDLEAFQGRLRSSRGARDSPNAR